MVMKSLKTYILVRNLFKISFVEIIKLGLVKIKFSMNLYIRSSNKLRKPQSLIELLIINKMNLVFFCCNWNMTPLFLLVVFIFKPGIDSKW